MIYTGIKASMADWHEKVDANPDFFELIVKQEDNDVQDSAIVKLESMGLPWFGHLPTSFDDEDDKILLNIASANRAIRIRSRVIIGDIIDKINGKFSPKGWILHTPTSWNFSTKRKLFGKGGHIELQDAINWISSLGRNVFIENVPPSLMWKGEVYNTEPYEFQTENPLLDTGHLYASTQSDNAFLVQMLKKAQRAKYFHLASLTANRPFDVHGKVFAAKEQEFPDINLLRNVLSNIVRTMSEFEQDVYLVCEPGGDASLHKNNLELLRNELSAIMHSKK